jgi:hypothetical protein
MLSPRISSQGSQNLFWRFFNNFTSHDIQHNANKIFLSAFNKISQNFALKDGFHFAIKCNPNASVLRDAGVTKSSTIQLQSTDGLSLGIWTKPLLRITALLSICSCSLSTIGTSLSALKSSPAITLSDTSTESYTIQAMHSAKAPSLLPQT